MKSLSCQLHREALLKSFTIVSHSREADLPIGSAKKGLPFLFRARNTRIQFKPRI
jgi:hypothetical protein